MRRTRRIVYSIVFFVGLVASIVGIIESKYFSRFFIKAPEVIQISGQQSTPRFIWSNENKQSLLKGIAIDLPVKLTNNNNLNLKVKKIEVDWGPFDLEPHSISVKDLSSPFKQGHLFGECKMITRYESQPEMLNGKYKDFLDFPFDIRPSEELLVKLEISSHFNEIAPYHVFALQRTKTTDAALKTLMPFFFGFKSPNPEKDRIPIKEVRFLFNTNHGILEAKKKLLLPFPGTTVLIKSEGLNLRMKFD